MSASDSQSSTPGKATLFCSSCGREGHAMTEWPARVDPVSDVRRVYCPGCGATLTTRPVESRSVTTSQRADGAIFSPADD